MITFCEYKSSNNSKSEVYICFYLEIYDIKISCYIYIYLKKENAFKKFLLIDISLYILYEVPYKTHLKLLDHHSKIRLFFAIFCHT